MTFWIEKESDGRGTILRLSGRLGWVYDELTTQLAGDQAQMVLDLDALTLLDVDVVRFLNACAANGVELLHCRPCIREWMIRKKACRS